jgi:hypothetical protein
MSPTPQSAQAEPAVAHSGTSTRAREALLLAALLAGKTIPEAATDIGASVRTCYRIRARESFQARYRAAKDELLSAAVAALHTHSLNFIETLASIAADGKLRGSERVQASREGLAALFKGVEIFEIEQRLQKLEGIAGGRR